MCWVKSVGSSPDGGNSLDPPPGALEKLPSLSFLIPSRDELVPVEYPVLTSRSVGRSEGLGLPAWVWPGIYLTPYLFLQVHLLSFFVCFVGF